MSEVFKKKYRWTCEVREGNEVLSPESFVYRYTIGGPVNFCDIKAVERFADRRGELTFSVNTYDGCGSLVGVHTFTSKVERVEVVESGHEYLADHVVVYF